MKFGIDSFAAFVPQPGSQTVFSAAERMENPLAEIKAAESASIDVFELGEHHRADFLDSAPAVILAAAAARTSRIRLTSAVTVLSAADPVRVFQQFATLDLLSKGRAEIVVGRGSFGEAFPLFGYAHEDYNALFAEKLELLLRLNVETHPIWRGQYRPVFNGQGVYPRPHLDRLPDLARHRGDAGIIPPGQHPSRRPATIRSRASLRTQRCRRCCPGASSTA